MSDGPAVNRVIVGDCREVLRALPENSVDACVTDPPYHLTQASRGGSPRQNDPETPFGRTRLGSAGFMGKTWDGGDIAFKSDTWREVLRVLKPGGHLLAFGGTRTYHRMACAIEDAGFEIRDQIQWLYGSGFPKSLDVSKAIDRSAGVEREDKFEGAFDRKAGPTGNKKCGACGKWLVSGNPCACPRPQDKPKTAAAAKWDGWGTALKPANEPIVVARKPCSEPTVAANVLKWGTGALHIDACRASLNGTEYKSQSNDAGRWPANVVIDEWAGEMLDAQTGILSSGDPSGTKTGGKGNVFGHFNGGIPVTGFGDSGGASRFFYCAKASQKERNLGLDGMASRKVSRMNTHNGNEEKGEAWHPVDDRTGRPRDRFASVQKNHHPTVKPIALMEWLTRLVTPMGGLVLDPFLGSGTTVIACARQGFRWLGIEQEPEYVRIAEARIAHEKDGRLL